MYVLGCRFAKFVIKGPSKSGYIDNENFIGNNSCFFSAFK